MGHTYVRRGGTILQESRAYSIVGNLDVRLWTCVWLWQQAGRPSRLASVTVQCEKVRRAPYKGETFGTQIQVRYHFVVSCHVPQGALCASAVNNPSRHMGRSQRKVAIAATRASRSESTDSNCTIPYVLELKSLHGMRQPQTRQPYLEPNAQRNGYSAWLSAACL